MGNASFVQTSFLGGEWSPRAQGRMVDPAYKTAMNVCLNGLPTEEGMWTRRSGMRFLAHTRRGQEAKLAAFDFTVSQPYQMEFTSLKLRFFAGLSLVTLLTENSPVYVAFISSTNPVKVYLGTEVPSGWANGNTVVFKLPSVPATMPSLLNRQFEIANLDTTAGTFTLVDSITGAAVDGTGYTYTPAVAGAAADTVEKVFEITTVWGTSTLPNLRLVTSDTTVLILSGAYKPYLLSAGSPFTLAAQNFIDGPYMELNTTATTMVCSAASGTVTVIASQALGINGGRGFLSTDVGRLIRIQSAPAAWSVGTTYTKDQTATGSDGNIYNSVAGANLGHDPTTDDGTHWVISSATVQWVWLTITAVTNNVQVTAVVEAPAPGSSQDVAIAPVATTTKWRMGLYSDTTGWPSAGVYHEGRLWLASTAFGNRVDASVANSDFANGVFNFSPTDVDGNVAASNAVSAIANATDVNYFFWMISTEDGLVLGSQSSEWRVRASSLDDPISPTSIQMRRVSNWGCANIEPIQASLNVFVQRHKRKLLAHLQVSDQKYSAENLSHLADHLTAPGVEEIRWQQEPPLTIWSRCTDGSLTGTVFQRGYNTWARTGQAEDSFGAFFSTVLGDGRTFESISTGPTYDGLSTTLYAVTNQPSVTAPDHNIRWVQGMMPEFDSSQSDWQSYYTDGGANPSYAQRMAIANGDSFDGVRIFGLWNLNGRIITPVLGGLDLGDHAVANGYCDVPFSSDPDQHFTLAFFTGLSNGTDYAEWEVSTGYVQHISGADAPIPADYLMGFVGPDSDVTGSRITDFLFVDPDNNRVIEVLRGTTTNQGLRRFNYSTGDEVVQADPAATFSILTGPSWDSGTDYGYGTYIAGTDGHIYQKISENNDDVGKDPTNPWPFRWTDLGAVPVQPDWTDSAISFLHRDGHVYTTLTSHLFDVFYKIDATTLATVSRIGCHDNYASILGSGYHYASGVPTLSKPTVNMAGPRANSLAGTPTNFIVYCGAPAAGHADEVVCINVDDMRYVPSHPATNFSLVLDEPKGSICTAADKDPYGAFYIAGSAFSFPSATPVGLYRGTIQQFVGLGQGTNDGLGWRCQVHPIVKIDPSDVDAGWTEWLNVYGPAYDKSDGTFVVFYNGDDGIAGPTIYAVKYSPAGVVLWSTHWLGVASDYFMEWMTSVMDIRGRIVLMKANAFVHEFRIIDTATGAMTTQAINTGVTCNIRHTFDPVSSSMFFGGSYTPPGGGPAITTVGNYLPAHSDTLTSQWGRYSTGLGLDPTISITTYNIPISVGTTFTSRGQILRPDFGPDSGAQNGPGFGKLRRIHKYAVALWRSRGISLGTVFGKLFSVKLQSPGKTVIQSPALYSGIISDTLQGDDNFEGQIAWEVTRPYPVNITAMGGYIQTTDK